MTISNKNTNKNIINIRIGETKKKRTKRKKGNKKSGHDGPLTIMNNIQVPQMQPQMNMPSQPPPAPPAIHPVALHYNRNQNPLYNAVVVGGYKDNEG